MLPIARAARLSRHAFSLQEAYGLAAKAKPVTKCPTSIRTISSSSRGQASVAGEGSLLEQSQAAPPPQFTRSATKGKTTIQTTTPAPGKTAQSVQPVTLETQSQDVSHIESLLQTHPLTLSLRQSGTHIESRPHLTMPQQHREPHLIAGSLGNASQIPVPALYFFHTPSPSPNSTSPPSHQTSLTSIFYISTHTTGHPGIIHGGLLGALLDEAFARCAARVFPDKIAVTANLAVDYRAPAVPGRVYVLTATTEKVEGRKAWVSGRLEMEIADGEGETMGERKLVVEGKSLFVESRLSSEGDLVYRD